jgi:hypothetical protein
VKGLQSGLEKARADAQGQIDKGATGGKLIALQNAVKEYDSALSGLKSGNPTRGQLDGAADALFHTMAPADIYNAKGEPTSSGMDESRITSMEKEVGLTTQDKANDVGMYKWYNPANLFRGNDREVVNNLYDQIPNGGTAHVGVNLYGEALAKGAGPDGEPIQKSSSGELYYQPKGTADNDVSSRVYINLKPAANGSGSQERGIDHAVLFGKNADGTRYIYNPNGDPPYLSEKKGDSASTDALNKMAASLMARTKANSAFDDYGAKITNY